VNIVIGNKRLNTSGLTSVGKGGEADVYLHDGKAVKIYKAPDHPDFALLPDADRKSAQKYAAQRIQEQGSKLPSFPKNLPDHVIKPIDLVHDEHGKVVGYTMQFLSATDQIYKYADRVFRDQGIAKEFVVRMFRDLHSTVQGIHRAACVIGDFNNLNVLVPTGNPIALVIDADSFQFGKFICAMYTETFVDPLLCDQNLKSPKLIRKHCPESDWFAYCTMLFNSLLFAFPYGGVHRPKNLKQRVDMSQRSLKQIWIGDSEVIYPRPAEPLKTLPDDVLHYFEEVFCKGKRGEFPAVLLDILETGRPAMVIPPTATKTTVVVHGNVVITNRFFTASGIIFKTTQQAGRLRYLYHEGKSFRREDDRVVLTGAVDPHVRWRILGNDTILAKATEHNRAIAIVLPEFGNPRKFVIDAVGNAPMLDSNSTKLFYMQCGELKSETKGDLDALNIKSIGKIVDGQTYFWVGEKFGFGFYRAGNLSGRFIFDTETGHMNDTLAEPKLSGQLIDATCEFSDTFCWFMATLQQGKKTVNRCYVIKSNGVIVASAEAEFGDDSWLGSIRGKFAYHRGPMLFSPTDEGIAQVVVENGSIVERKRFADTEPFVDSASALLPDNGGRITVVKKNEIRTLELK
jgi:hypothetical protein